MTSRQKLFSLREGSLFAFLLFFSITALAGLFSDDLRFEGQKKSFLPAEEAFIASISATDADKIVATFVIQDGYYLYKDKFKFSAVDKTVSIDKIDLPKGDIKEDPLFGKVEVYHGKVVIPIHFTRTTTDVRDVEIEAAYQGCAEDGICYPPLKTLLPISLAAASDQVDRATPTKMANPFNSDQQDKSTESSNDPDLSDSDRIATLLTDKPLLISLALFFGFGMTLSLTPCVYPMIPILSGLLVGQGVNLTTRKSLMLALSYVLGMALTYAVVGVVAGIFGENLQAVFQNPWILATFAGVFVLLALSMFGFYDIQLPSSLQARLTNMSNNQVRGTLQGAGLMGIFSAIIVGPCVAPPLAGALIYIGQTGNAFLGGSALFIMGLGMGVPLLLLGASAGEILPKAGVWMNTVKHVFGVLMLAVAIWLLERILPAPLILALWGLLLIGSAVYMGAFDTLTELSTGWQRLWKAVGIAMVLYGTLLIIGSASGAKDVFQPLKNLTGFHNGSKVGEQEGLGFTSIKGVDGLNTILKLANRQNKPVMLDFYADWCIECKRMDKTTFDDPQVKQQLEDVILAQTDVTSNDKDDQNLLKSFELLGPPAILFFNPDGTEKRNFRITGYADPVAFKNHVEKAFN